MAAKPGRAGHGYHHGMALALQSWGMVADDAEELVADEPEVPVLELVTQESPREGSSSMRARVAAGVLALAALFSFGGKH